jgi:hypothetical protein
MSPPQERPPETTRGGEARPPGWLLRISRVVQEVVPPEFVGQIEINVFKGGISRITVTQSYKDKDWEGAR